MIYGQEEGLPLEQVNVENSAGFQGKRHGGAEVKREFGAGHLEPFHHPGERCRATALNDALC